MNQFVYDINQKSANFGVCDALKNLYKTAYPVIICIGSDLAIGDSLGPVIGSELQDKLFGKAYVYGTLDSPITAKEIKTVFNTINMLHPKSKVLVIDAAVGNKEDVGKIKIADNGLKPGLGVNKDLEEIGDVSIIGIVADKETPENNIYNKTRLSLINKASKIIVSGIIEYLK